MDEDAGSFWHPVNLLVVAVGVLAVLSVVVVGTLDSFFLPLMIVVVFAMSTGGSDLGGVGWAASGTLAVAAVAELAVVLPLAKSWDLAKDDERPQRSDFCPPPSG